jgi:hypothetical protein
MPPLPPAVYSPKQEPSKDGIQTQARAGGTQHEAARSWQSIHSARPYSPCTTENLPHIELPWPTQPHATTLLGSLVHWLAATLKEKALPATPKNTHTASHTPASRGRTHRLWRAPSSSSTSPVSFSTRPVTSSVSLALPSTLLHSAAQHSTARSVRQAAGKLMHVAWSALRTDHQLWSKQHSLQLLHPPRACNSSYVIQTKVMPELPTCKLEPVAAATAAQLWAGQRNICSASPAGLGGSVLHSARSTPGGVSRGVRSVAGGVSRTLHPQAMPIFTSSRPIPLFL